MKKSDILIQIQTAVTALSEYDPGYYKVERERFYMRATKEQLEKFLADLQRRLSFAERAKSLGATIVTRRDLRGKELQQFIKAGVVVRDVGIGLVEERTPSEQDIRAMLVVI